MKLFLLILLLAGAATVATAQESAWDTSANLELQSRYFTQDAAFPRQDGDALQWSLAGELELRWRGNDSRASIIGYARYDNTDDERSLIDLREAYWAKEGDGYELLIGLNTVFWGVTESVHLVDIINQTDFVSDIGWPSLSSPSMSDTKSVWLMMSTRCTDSVTPQNTVFRPTSSS